MINKIPLNVPLGIKYISEWKGYTIPRGKCIIDKKVCGCGYTQLCLTNKDNIILCSPRKSLLENKLDQNPQCFYFTPISISNKERKKLGLETEEKVSEYLYNLQAKELKTYCLDRLEKNEKLKILVTYDSLPKLIEILNFILDHDFVQSILVIVDEFQLIFTDARFKANVELDFVEYLEKYCENVVYLSGTPMLEDYLEAVPTFQSLPYYELDWGSDRTSMVKITKIRTTNLEKSAIEVVNLYKQGKGPIKIVGDKIYRSEEAVLFVNNVSMITEIIKGSKLTPEEVNIITAKTSQNLAKLKKCGKGFKFGRIPTKGKKNKLITICSSTAFCGIDMYSETAKAYIFSDCNIKTMAIDISIELPQIVGRQRLENNIFRKDITMYYTSSVSDYTDEDFKKEVDEKIDTTHIIINNYKEKSGISSIDMNIERKILKNWISTRNYVEDYTSISRDSGNPIFNNLILLADIRSWQLQKKIYSNDETIIKVLEQVGEIQKSSSITLALEKSASFPKFEDRLKYLSSYINDHEEDIDFIPNEYLPYLSRFSYGEMATCGFRKDVLDSRISLLDKKGEIDSSNLLRKIVLDNFETGKFYNNKEIKNMLIEFSKEAGFEDIKLKACDLGNYFIIKETLMTNRLTGKKEHGYRILSIKE